MLVKDIMTTNVITISEDKTMLEAQELMKSQNIRRVPVVDDIKRVLGIITDGDVGRASPSEASTLSRYEANYLLSRFKVRDVMTKDVITVRGNSGLEDIASQMYKHKINSLPVVDDKGCLIGTQSALLIRCYQGLTIVQVLSLRLHKPLTVRNMERRREYLP